MDVITYEGKTYTRRNQKWVDSRCMVVPDGLQKDLNREFARQLDPTQLSMEECIAYGDRFKNSSSAHLALKYYEVAALTADYTTMAYLLPRMTSCYRQNGMAQKAIELWQHATESFGVRMNSSALLTSVAAAYCDIGDYVNAKKCCDKAYKLLNGDKSEELTLVYQRIKKENTFV